MVALAPMAQKSHILRGLQALYVTPTFRLNTRSRIQHCSPIGRNWCSSASCLNKRIFTSANGFRIFGDLRFCSSPLGSSAFRVASGGGAGGGTGGGTGGGFGGSGGGSGSNGSGHNGNNWSLISWYLSLLGKYPVMTKAFTAALLNLVGDLICQLLVDQVATVDLKRALTFTLLGLVLVGPTLHFWYLYLSKLITASGSSGALMRLFLDQLCFAPIFIGTFLSALMTLEGRPSGVIPKLKQDWLPSVVANWQLWIPFQFLNFRYVPQPFQVLAANVVALIWNTILSYKAHKEVLVK